MKQSWFDLLVSVFTNFFVEKGGSDAFIKKVYETYIADGGEAHELDVLLEQMPEMIEPILKQLASSADRAIRVYNEVETEMLSLEARGLLSVLEKSGILNPLQRESLLDNLLYKESEEMRSGEFKYFIYDTLAERLDEEQLFSLNYLLFDRNQPQVLH